VIACGRSRSTTTAAGRGAGRSPCSRAISASCTDSRPAGRRLPETETRLPRGSAAGTPAAHPSATTSWPLAVAERRTRPARSAAGPTRGLPR
jgi:hypothetical protein